MIGEDPAFAIIHVPVVVRYPAFAFVGMPVSCPLLKLLEQDIFTVIEDFRCGHGAVIPGPSSNFGIQLSDELPLRPVAMDADHSLEFCNMSFHCLFTRSDECLEAKERPIVACFSGVGLSGRKLPHRPA